MQSVLFLGNSHLSALKLACDAHFSPIDADMRFFCARGADLYFTDIKAGKLVAHADGTLSDAQLKAFHGKPIRHPAYERNGPIADVSRQLEVTGGTPHVDLTGLSAIFYLAGLSPFDYVRQGLASLSFSLPQRRAHLESMLDRDFFMRRQIAQIRALLPSCRHYFIGRPLAANSGPVDISLHDDVVGGRLATQELCRDYLFDDVFMPPDECLDKNLLATRDAFCAKGFQQSAIFQGATTNLISDKEHMNHLYGGVILEYFVLPLLSRLSL